MDVLAGPVRLANNLYLVYHEWPHWDSGNVYVVTGEVTTLIDCGSEASFPQVKANLRKIGLRPSDIQQVIATHGDFDHTQGFHRLAGRCSKIPLLVHQADWQAMIDGDGVLTKAYLYGQPYRPLPAERCIPLSGNQLIKVGDGEMLFLHTPGHSAGSSCLLGEFDGQSWLIAGDTVGGGMIDVSLVGAQTWANYCEQWRGSLELLSQLDFDWVLTGHEPTPLSREAFDRGREHFGQMFHPWFTRDASHGNRTGQIVHSWPLPTAAD